MIAEVLKEDFFSMEEMANILIRRRVTTTEQKVEALERRIRSGTDHPPYSTYEGQRLFRKDLFRAWALKRPVVYEVKSA